MPPALKSRRHWVVLLGVGSLLIGLIGLYFLMRGPDPDARASELASYLEKHDWASVYEMASAKEKGLHSWGKDQFVQLMSIIVDERVGEIKMVKIHGDWQRQVDRKYFHFYFTASKGPEPTKPTWIALHLLRGIDDWHPTLISLPMQLNRLHRPKTRDRLVFLLSALERSGVDRMIRVDDGLEFSAERLKEHLEGKRPEVEIFKYGGIP